MKLSISRLNYFVLSYVVGGRKTSGAIALPTIKEALEDITGRYIDE